ncbi:class I SAM-dependent methyltransferase [Massilia suwonensis]|uniref:Class I SAM-dependent methyltransferase n=1 Tax=Massilia suwonensis TaxID=648895 RepID=A0ABW0MK58_9BURK
MNKYADDIAGSYDRIAAWFDDKRTRTLIEKPYLDYLTQALKPGAAILDLGCGTGEPILRYLLERQFDVTGVDASAAMIAIARQRFPDTRLLVGDMRALQPGQTFDAVIAWHSLFHLPYDDQRAMFAVFAQLLNPGGLLMFTSGSAYGEVWSDNGGEALYHASLDADEYRALLEGQGFRVIRHAADDAACGGATVWIAQYRTGDHHETPTRL